jgi:hypothetical protein
MIDNLLDKRFILVSVIYISIVSLFFLINSKTRFTKQKQVIFYFIIATIIPIFLFLSSLIIYK